MFDGRTAFDGRTYTQRWRDNCLGATQSIVPVDGVLYAAGHSHNCESEGTFEDGARHFFTAESAAAKQYQPWWPQANDGIGEGIGPRAVVEASKGRADYLWTGGEFTRINGVAQRGLTHFGQGPDTGAPATPQTPNVSSTTANQATIAWRTTTDTDDSTLTYTLYRGSSTTPIATLKADSQFYSRPELKFTDTGLTPGVTYSYRVKASDGTNVSAYSLSRSVTVAGTDSAYPSRIRSDGAAVYFRMEEPTGTAAASYGSGSLGGSYVNASTRAGQPGALVGRSDTSASFDGVSSFLRTEVRTPAPTVYSIETWFKTTSTRGGKLVGYGNRVMLNGGSVVPLSSKFDRQIYLTDDGRLIFGVASASRVTLSSPAGYNNGQWHHVVATQGAAGMALYVDGVRVASNAVKTAQAFSGFWRIGGDNLSGWPSKPTSDYFAGNIDETAIYPTALTATQIADHYRLSGRTLAAAKVVTTPAPLAKTAGKAPAVVVDATAPTTPTGVAAAVENQSVGLSWAASTDTVGVKEYQVYRSATGGFAPSTASKIADVTSGTLYSDRARPAGTWYYRVVAVDGAGNSGAPSGQASAAVVAPPDRQPPSAATKVVATVSGADVALSWTGSTDNVRVITYEVHRWATPKYAPSAADKIADVTSGTAYTDAARPAGTWYYRVVAVDAAGNASTVSNLATAVVAGAGELTPSTPAGSTVASASPPPAGGTTTG